VFENELKGKLPDSMGSLTHMKEFNIHDNDISGPLPSWIGMWKDLSKINIADNNFAGEIPTDFFRLEQVQQIAFSKNTLAANIRDFGEFKDLKGLFLDANKIDGTFDSTWMQGWKHLQLLDVSDCLLSGNMAPALFRLPNLIICDLHGNQLEGTLQITGVGSSKIEFLALQENQLVGSIPTTIGLLTSLQHLGKAKRTLSLLHWAKQKSR
jgi:hypothetical protein